MASDGKIIQFPKGKSIKIDNTAAELRENLIFTENLTEGLVVNMIHNMSENGIDVDNESFIRDTSMLIEMVKSILYRNMDMSHPIQNLVDYCVTSEKTDGRVSVSVDTEIIKDLVDFDEA